MAASVEQLNTVETSVDGWRAFIEESMQSDFYRLARERTGSADQAAALTLLRNYLSTFSPQEQRKLETNVEEFYRYAQGFINELAPYRYSNSGYDQRVRSLFIGKIRILLAEQKDSEGQLVSPERYAFVRTLVRFCSSLQFIVQVHDDYKQFLFRELPQLRTRGGAF
ncbi:MAG: hypothetical protein K1X75_09345 [Leptospirales bacterium]|nr:hypothetical protein [Leptospirales bacterium]